MRAVRERFQVSYDEMKSQGTADEQFASTPEQRSHERMGRMIAWAKRELPDEHAPFAAVAAMRLKLGGRPVNAQTVRKLLVETKKNHEANHARAMRFRAEDEAA
jgi:hypothetical protein